MESLPPMDAGYGTVARRVAKAGKYISAGSDHVFDARVRPYSNADRMKQSKIRRCSSPSTLKKRTSSLARSGFSRRATSWRTPKLLWAWPRCCARPGTGSWRTKSMWRYSMPSGKGSIATGTSMPSSGRSRTAVSRISGSLRLLVPNRYPPQVVLRPAFPVTRR